MIRGIYGALAGAILIFGAGCLGHAREIEARGIEPGRMEEGDFSNMAGFAAGHGWGTLFLGGRIRHDFVFFHAHYGRLMKRRVGEGTNWAGRWTIMGEATVARELHPGNAWVLSLAPVFRYQFERDGRVVPYLEGGYGITWTDLREPNLGGDLQFNGHIGGGAYWFVRPNYAYSVQYRFVHYSNAGLRTPNSGANVNAVLIGLTGFF